jgi:hypothetical protein
MPSTAALQQSMALDELHLRRLKQWRQTPETRVPDPDEAAHLIEQVGIATLFPASPEIPNLYHAYTGDPDTRPESEWDSPAGEVYGWRWALGRREAGFYTALVRGRPTWVSWALLPALLRLRGELRSPDELYRAGELSSDAHRVARALEECGGVLSTGELRRQAGFPTGKPQRTAYLKAVQDLDTRLLLAKVFSTDDEDMRHALVRVRYPEYITRAEQMSDLEALEQFLTAYLPNAVYAAPALLAKHLKLAETPLRAGLERLAAAGRAAKVTLAGYKGDSYIWQAREEVEGAAAA